MTRTTLGSSTKATDVVQVETFLEPDGATTRMAMHRIGRIYSVNSTSTAKIIQLLVKRDITSFVQDAWKVLRTARVGAAYGDS
jgi:hypothetical protein